MPTLQDIQSYAAIAGVVVGTGTLAFLLNFIREQREQAKLHLEVLRERLKAIEEDRDRTEKWSKRKEEELATENRKLQADLQSALSASGFTLESLAMGRSIRDVSIELQHTLETALEKAHSAELADPKTQSPEWHLSLAQGYMAQRDWKLAAEHFDSYTSLRPDDHEAQFSKGVSYANMRGGNESNHTALRAYNEAIAFLPANADKNWVARCYAYRAAVMRRLGRYDEAENDLALALRYSAEDYERSDVIYNLATVYALQGRRSEMLGMVKQLLSRRHLQEIRSHLNDNFSAYATDTEFLDLLASQIGKAAMA